MHVYCYNIDSDSDVMVRSQSLDLHDCFRIYIICTVFAPPPPVAFFKEDHSDAPLDWKERCAEQFHMDAYAQNYFSPQISLPYGAAVLVCYCFYW